MLLDLSILLHIPAATDVHHIFKDLISAEVWNNHKRQIHIKILKRWAAIPKLLPTMALIDRIFGPGPLKIAERQPRTRTIIAMYYSNGCHHRLCVNGNCFSFNQRRLPCQCIFCPDDICDNGHGCCCPALQGVTILERLKNLVYDHCVPKSIENQKQSYTITQCIAKNRTLACEFAKCSSLLFILFCMFISRLCDEAFVITIITISPIFQLPRLDVEFNISFSFLTIIITPNCIYLTPHN